MAGFIILVSFLFIAVGLCWCLCKKKNVDLEKNSTDKNGSRVELKSTKRGSSTGNQCEKSLKAHSSGKDTTVTVCGDKVLEKKGAMTRNKISSKQHEEKLIGSQVYTNGNPKFEKKNAPDILPVSNIQSNFSKAEKKGTVYGNKIPNKDTASNRLKMDSITQCHNSNNTPSRSTGGASSEPHVSKKSTPKSPPTVVHERSNTRKPSRAAPAPPPPTQSMPPFTANLKHHRLPVSASVPPGGYKTNDINRTPTSSQQIGDHRRKGQHT